MQYSAEVQQVARAWLESHLADIQRFSACRHRYLNAADREDAVAECTAYAWQWVLRAASLNKINVMSAHMISVFAAKLYRCGRRFGGGVVRPAVSLDSVVAKVESDEIAVLPMVDALIDNRYNPAEMARVAMDYGIAVERMNPTERKVWDALVVDHERGVGLRLAAELHLSNGRITQLKGQIARKLENIGYAPGSK